MKDRISTPALPVSLHRKHPGSDPVDRAIAASKNDYWSIRISEDAKQLMTQCIRRHGRDKAFWLHECIRAGLADMAGKEYIPAKFIEPAHFKK